MIHIFTEIPSGARSRGYEYDDKDREKAEKAFDTIVAQLQLWPKFTAEVWMKRPGENKFVEIANA